MPHHLSSNEPTHAELRALAVNARTIAHELRLESRELIARCIERRIAREQRRRERS